MSLAARAGPPMLVRLDRCRHGVVEVTFATSILSFPGQSAWEFPGCGCFESKLDVRNGPSGWAREPASLGTSHEQARPYN